MKKILYFDILRIVATFSVILLHICSQNWYSASVTSPEWQILNMYDAVVRWSVPVFVMISGALFLNAENHIGKIFKKNILRIVTAFLFWSILYAAVSVQQGLSLHEGIIQAIKGHYHLWFLYMITGLYLLVPLLKKITDSVKSLRYFLILALVFTSVIPYITMLLSLYRKETGAVASAVATEIDFHFTLGYASYFVLGYYLHKEEISRNIRKLLYIGSLFGFAGTILFTSWISLYNNQPIELFYDRFTINVLLESIGMFLFFKYKYTEDTPIRPATEKVIHILSKFSFGVYLVHVLVMEQLDRLWGLNTASFPTILSVPLLSILIFTISFAISAILNQIPILRKYIV